MPYNNAIPGQVNQYQLRAIELVAGLVPENGHVVEVGSLFGASSWCWAKSVHPSVTVHCIDPWEGNKGIRSIEERLGITYGLEQFKIYTADCPNVEPHKGYSPRDFTDWDQPIDLYYEDAVHTDPILSQNLDFWGGQLKPNGIMCGDDYRGRFPDVRGGAERKAAEMGRNLIVVENFWCLLPNPTEDEKLKEVQDALLSLAAEYRSKMLELGPHAEWNLRPQITRDNTGAQAFTLEITQLGILPWPENPASEPLTATVIFQDPETETEIAKVSTELETNQLMPDIKHSVALKLSENTLHRIVGRDLKAILRLDTTVDTDQMKLRNRRITAKMPPQQTSEMKGVNDLSGPGRIVVAPFPKGRIFGRIQEGSEVQIASCRVLDAEIAAWSGGSIHIGPNGTIQGARLHAMVGKIWIGEDCMIQDLVIISACDQYSHVSTKSGRKTNAERLGVTIGNHVAINRGAIIRPGVTIGDGAIIDAGAVVMEDIPACARAAGNPAQVIEQNITWSRGWIGDLADAACYITSEETKL